MTKKIFLIIGILVIVAVASFLIFTSKPQTETGESRVGFSIRDYLPFGTSDNADDTTAIGDNNEEEFISDIPTDQSVPRLRRLSGESVAGAVVFSVGTTSVVRFVEKGTGNVYEAKSSSAIVSRLTNTTIPKIIRALWLPNGSGFLAQTLEPESEIIETRFVKLNKNIASTTDESLTPFGTTIGKLPTGIKELTIKPDNTKIFYYTTNGTSRWFVSNPDGTSATLVATHPLTEWLPKWVSGNTIIMQTKSSYKTNGFVYLFDTSSKTLKKIGIEAPGLSVNSNSDGSLSLISSGSTFPQLSLVNNKVATSDKLGVSSLAEKCVWLKDKSSTVYCAVPNQIPSGNYPDVWYKGLASTEDFVEKMDLDNGVFSQIADLSDLSGQKIDVIDPSLSPDGSHLIFRNKIDGYLWILRIEQ